MAHKKKRLSLVVIIVVGFLLISGVTSFWCLAAEDKSSEKETLIKSFFPQEPSTELIGPDIKINNFFKPGKGRQVGVVQQAMGTAYVIHGGEKTAYRLFKKNFLFQGDALITLKKSRINALMNDKSVVAIAPMARMVISSSRYSEKEDVRSTIMDLVWGSARFIVNRITGKSKYEIHTSTAVCGVRGTDFAVSVTSRTTGEKKTFFKKIFSLLNSSSNAYAMPLEGLLTSVITGSASTVSLHGMIGPPVIIAPTSIAGVAEGAAAGAASFIGPVVAMGVLDSVGPGLALLDMPPEMEK